MIFDKLHQLGELKKMRDQALAVQKALAQEKVEIEEQGVKIVITGDQKVESLLVDGQEEDRLREVFNKALKRSQEIAAHKLSEMGGGLSGLLGQ